MTALASSALLAAARWDVGFGNPNKTAVLFASLALISLFAACRAKRMWLACVAWSATALLGYALFQTYSRGGAVAFSVGAMAVLVAEWRRIARLTRALPAIMVAVALAVAAVGTGFSSRMASSAPSEDASVGNRMVIWSAAPAMIVDAPGGWGLGRSGEAFMSWYQPIERHERYRTLVNSHLTWLVELGWCGRAAVVLGWLLAIGMCAVRLKIRGDPVPLVVWLCFSIASFFSSVAEEWALWIIPMVTLAPAIWTFFSPPSRRAAMLSALSAVLCSGGVLGALAAFGRFSRPEGAPVVCRSYNGLRIVLGTGEPTSWIVVDESVVGTAYGRALRRFAAMPENAGKSYGVAESVDAVPGSAERIALCGESSAEGPSSLVRFKGLKETRILSPKNPGVWLAVRGDTRQIIVYCGDFSKSCPTEDSPGLVVVPGAEDFLPNWPALAFGD